MSLPEYLVIRPRGVPESQYQADTALFLLKRAQEVLKGRGQLLEPSEKGLLMAHIDCLRQRRRRYLEGSAASARQSGERMSLIELSAYSAYLLIEATDDPLFKRINEAVGQAVRRGWFPERLVRVKIYGEELAHVIVGQQTKANRTIYTDRPVLFGEWPDEATPPYIIQRALRYLFSKDPVLVGGEPGHEVWAPLPDDIRRRLCAKKAERDQREG